MSATEIGLVIASAGSLGVLLTLFVLVWQARLLTRQTAAVLDSLRDASWQSIENRLGELSRLFVEYPSLRPYFYDGQEAPADPTENHRAQAMAQAFLDHFDYVLAHQHVHPAAWKWSQSQWEAWIITMFRTSPCLRLRMETTRDWYPPRLLELARRASEHEREGSGKPLPANTVTDSSGPVTKAASSSADLAI